MTTTVARASDPETSHDAADSVRDLTRYRAEVLHTLTVCGPMTDEELVDLHMSTDGGTPSGIRTRRAELVRLDRVRWTGDHVVGATGRRARVWAVVPRSEGGTNA